jgi:hypothetical protein
MAGAQEVVTADTKEELETKVEEWYARAAANGLEDRRIPWDPNAVQETAAGFGFAVWAHS